MYSETLPKEEERKMKEGGVKIWLLIPVPTRMKFQCSILTEEARLRRSQMCGSRVDEIPEWESPKTQMQTGRG